MIGRTASTLGAAALLAGATIAAQPTSRPAPRKDAERVICRTFRESGSRFTSYRACHTQAEWAEMRRQTMQNIDRIQNARPY
jgi:hypothetical protein